MIKSLKELKTQLDARAKADEAERDEEGRAVIEMTVLKDEDFLSDLSAGKTPVVSSEVADFLAENAMAFHPNEQICIRISSDCIDEQEEKLYTLALKEYYVRRYKQNRRDLKRNAFFSAVMALIGLAVLSAVVTFSVLNITPVLSEALDIFAWVFLWEAVDLFFLQRQVLRYERYRALRFIEAKVVFIARTER